MINVSTGWKEALGCYNVTGRDRLVPVNNIVVEYEQIDAVAQNGGTVTVNSAVSWSDHDEVMNLSIDYGSQSPNATLEPNEWVLDGGMVFDPSGSHAGWVSESMSKADGTFNTNPKLTISWSSLQDVKIPGLTIQWSSMLNEWPTEFNIVAKASGSPVATKSFTGNNLVKSFYEIEMVNYDSVEIEITKWCIPDRRVRLESVCMGMTVILNKSEVLSIQHSVSSDLLSFTLPQDSFTFEIDNVSEEWNPDNPTGRYAYLTERQRIIAKYAFKINGSYEWVTAGTYFMSEWTTPQNGITASFTAKDLTSFMTKKFVPDDITGYTYGDEISLKDLAEEAFEQAGLPININGTNKWQVCDELDDIDIIIPYKTSTQGANSWNFGYTCGEVIQLCANAGRAVIRPNTNGDVCIIMPDEKITDYYIDPFVAYANGEYELTKALKSVNVNDGEYIYTPSDGEATGEEQSISNCLLQNFSDRAMNAAWVSHLLLKRKTISGEFRADPRLTPLDVIKIDNKYASNQVYIDSVTWNYNGSFTGTYSGRVLKSIPLIDQMGEYYSGDIECGEYGGDE